MCAAQAVGVRPGLFVVVSFFVYASFSVVSLLHSTFPVRAPLDRGALAVSYGRFIRVRALQGHD